jgi:hypothetical protein
VVRVTPRDLLFPAPREADPASAEPASAPPGDGSPPAERLLLLHRPPGTGKTRLEIGRLSAAAAWLVRTGADQPAGVERLIPAHLPAAYRHDGATPAELFALGCGEPRLAVVQEERGHGL